MTVSIGVAALTAYTRQTLMQLLDWADGALHGRIARASNPYSVHRLEARATLAANRSPSFHLPA
ncbi:MAG: hypothetical protein ACOYMW_10200 [Candidatus Competibacteraceae bacterium]